MNAAEIEALKQTLRDGKRVVWNPEPTICRVVTSIGNLKDEPSEVAMVSSGHYVALYNCGWDEFYLIAPIPRPHWSSKPEISCRAGKRLPQNS